MLMCSGDLPESDTQNVFSSTMEDISRKLSTRYGLKRKFPIDMSKIKERRNLKLEQGNLYLIMM